MNTTGIHHRAAHTPKPGIALLHVQKRETEDTLVQANGALGLLPWRTSANRKRHYGLPELAGTALIGGTTPPAVETGRASGEGASPHTSFDAFQSGTFGSGHSRTPMIGRRTGMVAVYRSVWFQICTGRRTSCVDSSLNFSRMVTGNGMVVARRRLISATSSPPVCRIVTPSTAMSSTSVP